jgi:hypothetical protein
MLSHAKGICPASLASTQARSQSADFKGVWIPREIWLSDKLSLMEKVLFVEINSLDNERGRFASNRYFADFFDISDRQIRNIISSLRDKGFITVTVRNKNERVIRVVGKYRRVPDSEIRIFQQEKGKLIHSMSLNRG